MSSFRRKVKSDEAETSRTNQSSVRTQEVSASGVKPWVNTGLGIVSSGLRHLDDLLGGGIPLGTTILTMNDSYSGFGQALAGYSCAESISHAQHTALLSFRVEDSFTFRSSLPLNRNLDPESEPEKEVNSSSGLTIAWQYEKYLKAKQAAVPRANKSGSLQFCCSYDLSKRMQPSLEQAIEVLSLDIHEASPSLSEMLQKMFEKIQQYVLSVVAEHPAAVVRVFVLNLESLFIAALDSPINQASTVARFMLKVKRFCWERRVLVSFSVAPAAVPAAVLDALQHACDTILGIESFSGRMHCVPYEFNRFHGFLVIHKLQQYGMLAPHKLSSSRYGIIRDRRKLIVEPLHLPPEESRAFPAKEDGSSSSREAVIGKAVAQAIGGCSSMTTIRKTADSHDRAHSHAHSHAIPETASRLSEQPISVASVAPSNSSNVASSAPKSSLASSLAAARAARLAGATQVENATAATTLVQPVSIASSKAREKIGNIDF
eukprot:gene37417-45438_t